MANNLNRILGDTRRVLSTRWSSSELRVPAWVIDAMIYITVLRSFSYGFELVFSASANMISPFMAFAAVLGVQTWGVLMLFGVIVLIIGLVLRNTIVIAVGTLICGSVWSAFAFVLCVGWLEAAEGGRYAMAALTTAATWVVFFYVQLKTIRINGVES